MFLNAYNYFTKEKNCLLHISKNKQVTSRMKAELTTQGVAECTVYVRSQFGNVMVISRGYATSEIPRTSHDCRN